MTSRFLLPLALAASCAASVLPREPAPPQLLKLAITPQQHDRPIQRRDNDVPLFNISSVSYLVELSLGTPGQRVKVAIDTGSDELWVNPVCNDPLLTTGQRRECAQDGTYVANKSSTATKLTNTNTIRYGKGRVSLAYYQDSISLPESTLNMTNVRFGAATTSSELHEGILGLGFGRNLAYNNLIDELAVQNKTTGRAFSIALGSNTASNGGVIIFGGVDTKKFTGALVSNPILGPQGGERLRRYWIQMDSVSTTRGGSSGNPYPSSSMPVVLDSGSTLSYLPSALVRAMANDLGGSFDSQLELYTVPCSTVSSSGSVDFTFGQATIRVPFSEFIWQIGPGPNDCILGAVPVDSAGGITALLGDSFMRSAFTVFDQGRNTISMAQYANCGENEQIIPADGPGSFTGECSGQSANTGNGNSDTNKNAAGRTVYSTSALALALLAAVVMTAI